MNPTRPIFTSFLTQNGPRTERCVPLESKHLFYWEVNFVYILNNLPAANDTDNVNEVSRVNANFWQMVSIFSKVRPFFESRVGVGLGLGVRVRVKGTFMRRNLHFGAFRVRGCP